ncbi:hypothetical protein GCM10007063_05710 [Lentibacillus kapialis]|uniref:DUF1492 domain-containing protein n=1 Tax=Lentibacillus kapialis TaxID=340214 RepID=A0A917PNS8_9BACI|nr:hypothetical protein [Lentibacillus kapialis]GGJ86059.1 hypothetical protein GCM10007063_05710 [Lentibacillus kapialis]
MQIMKSYSDLIIEIELVKDQVEFTKREIEYWTGVDMDKEQGIPLDSKGTHKYGLNASLYQTDKKINSYHQLKDRLKHLEYAKVRMDILMEKLSGIDYKIAYKRIVEHKTHQEIADELMYTHQYIREKWARIKTYTQHTENIAKA